MLRCRQQRCSVTSATNYHTMIDFDAMMKQNSKNDVFTLVNPSIYMITIYNNVASQIDKNMTRVT